MKVFAKVADGSKTVLKEVHHELGIQIVHPSGQFTIAEDNHGRLILRSLHSQIVIVGEASNSVQIKEL